MSGLRLYLLGPPRIERDGVPIQLNRHKDIALVAYLAVTGERHTREALVTLLWPELEPSRARAGLRRNLSALRRMLGEGTLVVDRQSVGLGPDVDLWLDMKRFRQLLRTSYEHVHADGHDCPNCLAALTEAVELYRGDFLEGFSLHDSARFDEWQFFQTERLRGELAAALERLVRDHSVLGDYEQAIPYGQRWAFLDPLHEPAQQSLMRIYAQARQRAAALRQYNECVRILDGELGLAPSPETTALYERIRAGRVRDDGGKAERELPPSSALPIPHNLPAQASSFVGRADERAEIVARLRDPGCRLLTVVGPGGIGKTRLAVQAAMDLAAELQGNPFEQGIYFVALAPLQTPETMVPAVAQAIGFSFQEGSVPRQQLVSYLRQKRLLLVLDNFEHLLPRPGMPSEEAVSLVGEILVKAPQVKILATSRARLNARDEHLFHLGGMDTLRKVPPTSMVSVQEFLQYSAVQLFVQGARRARSDFELSKEDVEHVSRICRLVHGMPLGLLLAAAWVEMLSLPEIAAGIEGQMPSTGLDFLEADWHDAPERQRSMRAAYDHSWNLLSDREREVFQGLAVFRGGFARSAAQAVTGATLRELTSLARKSLIHRTPAPSSTLGAGARFEVHELLRQYAAEKLERSLAGSGVTYDRHATYYAGALQAWAADLRGSRQTVAVEEMRADVDNVRAAWDWAVVRDQVEWLDRALEGLCRFYQWESLDEEGEAACCKAADRLGESAPHAQTGAASASRQRVLAHVLAWQGDFSDTLGRIDAADRCYERALAVLDYAELSGLAPDARREKAFILVKMGGQALHTDLERARQLTGRSLELYQSLGDRWGMAYDYRVLGRVLHRRGAFEEARRLFEKSLSLLRALGDRRGMVWPLINLSWTLGVLGQYGEAERVARESVSIVLQVGDRALTVWAKGCLGAALYRAGRFAEARSLFEENLAFSLERGSRSADAYVWRQLGANAKHLGAYEEARTATQSALTLFRESGQRAPAAYCQVELGRVALTEGAYGGVQEGLRQSIAIYQRVGWVQSHTGEALAALAYVARGLGHLTQARQHLGAALRIAIETHSHGVVLESLPAAALLLMDAGEVERAIEIYALASRYPFVANSRWFEDVAGVHVAAAADGLPPEVVAAAQEWGRAADPWDVAEALLGELEMPE